MGIRSNNSAQSFFDIFTGTGTRASGSGGGGGGSVQPNGHTATGGIISDYEEGGTVYRSHTFINPGTFVVSQLSSVHPANIEYLVVGGGGGGSGSGFGSDGQGGGGAGGLRSNHPSMPVPTKGPDFAAEVTTYNIDIGLGGFGGRHYGGQNSGNACLGRFGKTTNFYKNGINYPSTQYIRAIGGGRAGGFGSSTSNRNGEPGGSGGGGAGGSDGAGGNGNQPAPPNNWPQPVGNPGGSRGGNYSAGGGGGFISAGQNGVDPNPGDGGAGINLTMESGIATGYAGGGSGGSGGPGRPDPGANHGVATHGGGTGGTGRPTGGIAPYVGGNGLSGTGGGGGGSSSDSGPGSTAHDTVGWGGGSGGPGIVVVRYEIGQKNTAKATGGLISFYNGKTIHTFREPGTFTASEELSCECVLIGGGGGGGYQNAGGGGAGGYQNVTNHPVPAAGHAVTVGEYGHGNGNGPSQADPTAQVFSNGGSTTFAAGSLQVDGGGAGGSEGPYGAQGAASSGPTGGSGGGGGRFGNSAAQGGTFGNDGGIGAASSPYVAGGGGGGAGGNGENGLGPTSEGGNGGLGVQLPATFRNPNGFKFGQGPDDSYFWVAGGGAGGSGSPGGSRHPRGGTGPSGAPSPRCGGGGGGTPYGYNTPSEDRVTPNSTPGMMGTGGGGGAGGESVGTQPYTGPRAGSPGGSGIVLIAYPT